MPKIEELYDRTIAFFKQSPNNLTAKFATDDKIEHLGSEEGKSFSVFIPSHLDHALQIAAEFMEIANILPNEDGLQQILEKAENLAETEDNEAVKYALKVFITHHPKGNILPIPSLENINPDIVIPSRQVLPFGIEELGGLGVESQLDYFREDTEVNEHHQKWHIVYPFQGIPNLVNPLIRRSTKPRQGELFWYMHQQMLARYDTERISHGLSKTVSINDFTLSIEGYEANLQGYGDRKANLTMQDISGYSVAAHKTFKDRLFEAAHNGKLQNDTVQIPIDDISVLCDSIEANADAKLLSTYGNFHNMGHLLLAEMSSPNGVMINTATAVRDPIFFRWHRLIDDIIFEWQETLSPYDFSTDAPRVRLRKQFDGEQNPDILLCFKKDIAEASDPNFDGQTYGEMHFGGVNRNASRTSFPMLTDELQTTMKIRQFADSNGNKVEKNYLDFEEFFYFFRLENDENQPCKVTARVFLAASELAADRRFWIEMDKFPVQLAANEKKVIYRPSRFSSVVRKPAFRPSENHRQPQIGVPNDNYCDCGWAYHLLLPRGTESGMDFKLLVMLTDWNLDSVGEEKKCGSMSFCGAKDKEYPDKRPMGYPFDRPFKNLSIAETINIQPNMAVRDFKIRFVPPH